MSNSPNPFTKTSSRGDAAVAWEVDWPPWQAGAVTEDAVEGQADWCGAQAAPGSRSPVVCRPLMFLKHLNPLGLFSA